MRTLLMSPSTSKEIPSLIYNANRRNYKPLAEIMLAVKKSQLKSSYDAMALCVICYEDYPLLKKQKKKNASGFLKNYWIERVENACRIWNNNLSFTSRARMKNNKIPVLLISGNRDAATPPEYGERVAKYFTEVRHIIVQQGSHSFDGMRNCVDKIISEFVQKGTTKNIQTQCIEDIKFPKYKIPDTEN
jgi:pimeloyl-ACP methyl ester carboxylesterase